MPDLRISSLLMIYISGIMIYLLALVAVGFYKIRSVKNSEDFMVAGRTLPWYILVGTLLATWMGSGSLFSGAGLGYRNGLAGLWSSGGAWLGIALIYFITRRIRNFGKVTVPDIFEARYGRAAAVLATVTTVIAYTTIVSYQFRGGGKVLSMVSDGMISLEAGIIITAVFAISYTVLAGMFSVVYTDVVNGVLMTGGTLGALLFLIFRVGGLGEIAAVAESAGKWQLFGNWAAERTGDISGPIIAISFFVPTMLLLMGDANMYQRIFSARDGGSAKKAVFFWIIGVIVLESAISMLGLTGAVAAAKGLIPDLVADAQGALVNPTEGALLEARQAGSESVIPAIV
ncbi:MAG: sodium:solute symporter family protein, partial [Candidatus Neomarinimicrobiota bacterium]|nr:sodium:solute symporter family protein [Candidatus Neomarinimicrobiota bacterium]